MFKLNGKPLAIDTPFECNEISYPANWLRLASPEERAAIGITEEADAPVYDDRFYWGVNSPKQLEDLEVTPEEGEPYTQKGLKSQWIAQVKDTTNKLLSATDWMVIRKVERDVAIPVDVMDYRAAVLGECDRLIDAIEAAADVEALITVLANQGWPEA